MIALSGLVLIGCHFLHAQERLSLLRNGGFEEDEMTFRGEPAASCGGHNNDQWFNMQDRFPDGWVWPNVYGPLVFGIAKQSEWPRCRRRLNLATPMTTPPVAFASMK